MEKQCITKYPSSGLSFQFHRRRGSEWVGKGRSYLACQHQLAEVEQYLLPLVGGWRLALSVPANTTGPWESGCCPWLDGEVGGSSASCSVSLQQCRRRAPLACDYSGVGISINSFLLCQFQGTGIAWIFLCLFVCFCLWVLSALGWNLLQPMIRGKQ